MSARRTRLADRARLATAPQLPGAYRFGGAPTGVYVGSALRRLVAVAGHDRARGLARQARPARAAAARPARQRAARPGRGEAVPALPRPRDGARCRRAWCVVTGTNGKTTTTKMVATLLGAAVPGADQRHRQQLRPRRDHRTVEHASLVGPAALRRRGLRARRGVGGAVRRAGAAAARAAAQRACATSSTGSARSTPPPQLLGKVAAATTGHVVLNRDDERIAALAADTTRAGQLLRRGAGAARAVPQRRGALRRADRSLRAAGRGRAADAARAPATALDAADRRRPSTTSMLRAEGPHNAQNAAGAAAAGTDLRPRRRTTVAAGLRAGVAGLRTRPALRPRTAAASCCSW